MSAIIWNQLRIRSLKNFEINQVALKNRTLVFNWKTRKAIFGFVCKFGGGRNKEETAKEQVKSYLKLSRSLSEKIGASLLAIYERVLSTNQGEVHATKIETPEYFHGMLNKQIALVERRVIRDETIPAKEKIHSLFEPHTEWLYKGKSNKRAELGHNILVTSDQWGFIVDHRVVEKQADVSLSIPLVDRLLSRYGEDAIESMSFDKVFTRKRTRSCRKSICLW